MIKSMISAAFIAAILFGISTNAFGQKKSKEKLIKRSNWQMTADSILVLGGLTESTSGLFIMASGEEKLDTGSQLLAWGLVTAIVGTPVLTVGIINRLRANRMSFKNEPIHIPKFAENFPRSIPSISYSIPLN